MADQYQFFHASCLREENVTVEAGELLVCLREAIVLKGEQIGAPEPVTMRLEAGSILYAADGLTNVPHAIGQHLHGTVLESELRFAIGVLLGFEPSMRHMNPLSPEQEKSIDVWLDRYSAFVVEVGEPNDELSSEFSQRGLFNGLRRHWQLEWGPPPADR